MLSTRYIIECIALGFIFVVRSLCGICMYTPYTNSLIKKERKLKMDINNKSMILNGSKIQNIISNWLLLNVNIYYGKSFMWQFVLLNTEILFNNELFLCALFTGYSSICFLTYKSFKFVDFFSVILIVLCERIHS